MIIKYFNQDELSYSTRKRYNNFTFEPFYTESQFAISLGDGAHTTIKTSSNNICNYVTIDETRWFVITYRYINGGQVILDLQRDVIGEFGIRDCFGKVERGYTDNILKYCKELKVNQILKKRNKLIPDTTQYGNITISSPKGNNPHNNEMWGIMYFSKPANGDLDLKIQVSGLVPSTLGYPFVNNGSIEVKSCTNSTRIEFKVSLYSRDDNNDIAFLGNYRVSLTTIYDSVQKKYTTNSSIHKLDTTPNNDTISFSFTVKESVHSTNLSLFYLTRIFALVSNAIGTSQSGYVFPDYVDPYNITDYDYNGVVVKNEDKYYKYNVSQSTNRIYGNFDSLKFCDTVGAATLNKAIVGVVTVSNFEYNYANFNGSALISNFYEETINTYNYVEVSPEEAGNFIINIGKPLIDEPFVILCCPLFDVNIQDTSGNTYNITRDNAFNIFNSIIESASGQNASLVDAQIYPYCPLITGVATTYKNFPLFNINSSSYSLRCTLQLLPYADIKKEYTVHEYSIIAPDQSSKFTFNYYDYNRYPQNVQNGINYDNIEIIIKTALKPFSIISSAVIARLGNSLAGIPYESDLRGCQPTSNGFECSLSTDKFQEYSRNNSMYEKLYNNSFEELQMSHKMEAINERTQTAFNVVNASAFGAIAGATAANFVGASAAGAAAGGIAAGSVTAGFQTVQNVQNQEVRDTEERLFSERYQLNIQTIQNLPNSVNRISAFNEIILSDFCYVIETYECTEEEIAVIDTFYQMYGYSIGVYDFMINYYKRGYFLKGNIITSSYTPILHAIAQKELLGGIYYYDYTE